MKKLIFTLSAVLFAAALNAQQSTRQTPTTERTGSVEAQAPTAGNRKVPKAAAIPATEKEDVLKAEAIRKGQAPAAKPAATNNQDVPAAQPVRSKQQGIPDSQKTPEQLRAESAKASNKDAEQVKASSRKVDPITVDESRDDYKATHSGSKK